MIQAKLRATVLTALIVFCFSTSIQSQPTAETRYDEYLLLGNADRGAGEPWVVVNPRDPNNIIVVAMATLNRLPGGEIPIPRGKPGATELRVFVLFFLVGSCSV